MACRAGLRLLPLRPRCPSSSGPLPVLGLPWPPRHFPPVSRQQICRVHSSANTELTTRLKDDERSPETWKVKMLYDGECPLCMREVHMLKERNKQYGAIKFVDISSNDYCAEENEGLDYRTVMGRIHAVLSDGTVLTDVDAFRRFYEEVGLGWVYAITKYKPIAEVANMIYSVWAKYRLQITGRPSLEAILESRNKKMDKECSDKSCKM